MDGESGTVDYAGLMQKLDTHKKEDEKRYYALMDKIDGIKKGDDDMSEGINTDKVIVNAGGSGDSGGGSMAAVIAALGNRNQGGDNAALIAALGNRNGGNGDGFGMGGGGLWPIILLALLGKRGFGGGDDDCGNGDTARTAILQTLMEGQADLRAQVPTTGLETQNALQLALAQLALGTQQGFANNKDAIQASLLAQLTAQTNTKDTVQNGFALTNNNVLEGLCSVKQTVRDDGDKTRGQIALYHEANLQRQLAVAEAALAEERTSRRVRDVEVSVSQTVNQTQVQAQAQAQQQAQFGDILRALHGIGGELQYARATNQNLIVGNAGATTTGAQTANPTNVRT